MRQRTVTDHQLELYGPRDTVFHRPQAGFLLLAIREAAMGNIAVALQMAQDAWHENYGDCHGVRFRVVTTTRTESTLGSWDDLGDDR